MSGTYIEDNNFEATKEKPRKLLFGRFKFDWEFDLFCWRILPVFNINFHFPCIDFEWLCFGLCIIDEIQFDVNQRKMEKKNQEILKKALEID